eukprot:scaffold2827_cov226-Pinguiococcus_pyrenoidosus.AAC.1
MRISVPAAMLARATSTTVSGLSEVCPTIIMSPGLKAPQVEAEGAGVPPAVGFGVGLLVAAPVGLRVGLGVGFGVGLGVGIGVATTTLKSDESCDTCVRSMKLFDEIQLLASLIRPCSVATLPVVLPASTFIPTKSLGSAETDDDVTAAASTQPLEPHMTP